MSAWDLHDARTQQLTAREEAELIVRLARYRAMAARTHRANCPCAGCEIRRVDANLRDLRLATARYAKAVAS